MEFDSAVSMISVLLIHLKETDDAKTAHNQNDGEINK